MPRPLRAEIDLSAILHNLETARGYYPEASLLGVVKADAYGHGAVEVASAIEPFCEALGVAAPEEAIALRESGITAPILLMEGCFDAEDLQSCEEFNFWTVIHSDKQLEELELFCVDSSFRPRLWIKLDTGMHRLGFAPDGLAGVLARIDKIGGFDCPVLMSHFACADSPNHPLNLRQIDAFPQGQSAQVSFCNSASCFGQLVKTDWIRLGIGMYGGLPQEGATPTALNLRPAMRLRTEIIALHKVPKGDSIGYGASFVTQRDSLIATLAIGYADGYPRHAKAGTPVVINGVEVPVAGRVSMDMLTVDVTDLESVSVGDEAVMFGPELAAYRVAEYCGTIDYTLFAGLTRRVPRKYSN